MPCPLPWELFYWVVLALRLPLAVDCVRLGLLAARVSQLALPQQEPPVVPASSQPEWLLAPWQG
ncbi:hypothetical protein D3C75_1097980 [compost metagenome]